MKKIYIVILFLFVSFPLMAQMDWINITHTNKVTAIERIGSSWWVGTTGGLIKYDTTDKSVTLFNCGNSELDADYINDLTVDDNQTLWVATKNGLLRYEGGRQFSNFSLGALPLLSYNILRVKNEKGKGLWIATDTSLSFYDGTNLQQYTKDDQGNKLENISYLYPVAPNGVVYANDNMVKYLNHSGVFSDYKYPGQAVRGLAFNGMNNLYVADWSANGGFYERTSQWDYFNKDNSPLADNQIIDLKNDSKYNVYFLHPHGFSMKTASGNYWSIETGDVVDKLQNHFTTAIYPDTLGALGLADGLLPYTLTENYDGGYSSRFIFGKVVNLNKSALESNKVLNLVIRKGLKYVGTRGVAIWDANNHLVHTYQSGSEALYNSTGAMDVDAFGRIWISDFTLRSMGSPNQIAWIDRQGKVTELDKETFLGFPISGVDAIQWETTHISATDTTGILWISYWGKRSGIAWYDGKTWNTFPDTTDAPRGFTQFVNDKNGVKWFATMMGIYSYDGKKLTSYWNVAPVHQATCVAMDHDGNLWFGGKPDPQLGWPGGLAKFDGTSWEHWDVNNSLLPDNYVTSIAVDTTGTIWVGTRSGGILKMFWPHSQVINQIGSVLDNNFIRKIVVDKKTNNVWFLNRDAGIFIYNEKGVVHTDVQNNRFELGNLLLQQNYPNPFSSSTTISYTIPKEWGSVPVTLQIFNLIGQKVNTLVNGHQQPGKYRLIFHPNGLSPGVYFYQIKAGPYTVVQKMILSR